MINIYKTNNQVDLSFAEALLKDARIDYFIADRHISIMEGSIGVFPIRVLVDELDADQARQLLKDAGLLNA